MKMYPAYFALTLAVLLSIFLCSCSFQVGIDWQGKTEKSNTTETPNYRSNYTAKGR